MNKENYIKEHLIKAITKKREEYMEILELKHGQLIFEEEDLSKLNGVIKLSSFAHVEESENHHRLLNLKNLSGDKLIPIYHFLMNKRFYVKKVIGSKEFKVRLKRGNQRNLEKND